MKTIRTYSELIKLNSYEERLKYLCLSGSVGDVTFGGRRDLNQILYRTQKWRRTRRNVILRDNGCDLAHPDYEIADSIYIHHLDPITIEDVLEENAKVWDLENLVCTTFDTHQEIHYGNVDQILKNKYVERTPFDTCPWRR